MMAKSASTIFSYTKLSRVETSYRKWCIERKEIDVFRRSLFLAGRKSLNRHPLIEDFLTVGRKLEGLGFIFGRGKVIEYGIDKDE